MGIPVRTYHLSCGWSGWINNILVYFKAWDWFPQMTVSWGNVVPESEERHDLLHLWKWFGLDSFLVKFWVNFKYPPPESVYWIDSVLVVANWINSVSRGTTITLREFNGFNCIQLNVFKWTTSSERLQVSHNEWLGLVSTANILTNEINNVRSGNLVSSSK